MLIFIKPNCFYHISADLDKNRTNLEQYQQVINKHNKKVYNMHAEELYRALDSYNNTLCRFNLNQCKLLPCIRTFLLKMTTPESYDNLYFNSMHVQQIIDIISQFKQNIEELYQLPETNRQKIKAFHL